MTTFTEMLAFVAKVEDHLGHTGQRIVRLTVPDNTVPTPVDVHTGRYGGAPVTLDPHASPSVQLSDGSTIEYDPEWVPPGELQIEPEGQPLVTHIEESYPAPVDSGDEHKE